MITIIGINSIPIKILKLAKEQISEQLCFICNLFFTTGIFPDSLKIAKVTPVYKKVSKLETLVTIETYHPAIKSLENNRKTYALKQG